MAPPSPSAAVRHALQGWSASTRLALRTLRPAALSLPLKVCRWLASWRVHACAATAPTQPHAAARKLHGLTPLACRGMQRQDTFDTRARAKGLVLPDAPERIASGQREVVWDGRAFQLVAKGTGTLYSVPKYCFGQNMVGFSELPGSQSTRLLCGKYRTVNHSHSAVKDGYLWKPGHRYNEQVGVKALLWVGSPETRCSTCSGGCGAGCRSSDCLPSTRTPAGAEDRRGPRGGAHPGQRQVPGAAEGQLAEVVLLGRRAHVET